jgi:hypothetical protein
MSNLRRVGQPRQWFSCPMWQLRSDNIVSPSRVVQAVTSYDTSGNVTSATETYLKFPHGPLTGRIDVCLQNGSLELQFLSHRVSVVYATATTTIKAQCINADFGILDLVWATRPQAGDELDLETMTISPGSIGTDSKIDGFVSNYGTQYYLSYFALQADHDVYGIRFRAVGLPAGLVASAYGRNLTWNTGSISRYPNAAIVARSWRPVHEIVS